MIPILIIGAVAIGFLIRTSTTEVQGPRERPRERPHTHSRSSPIKKLPPSPLEMLTIVVKNGGEPSEWLVNAAIGQAYDAGNFKLVNVLSNAFQKRLEEVSDESAPGEAGAEDAPVPSDAQAPPAPAPQSIALPSPIEGVPDDEWTEFAECMKTDDPGFENERHVGAFHMSKGRLKQLNITSISGEDAQYRAFVADVVEHYDHNKKLINDFVATPVEIDGKQHLISTSGMLGLMKAAGPKNALHWIQHPEERGKFPKTTELFIRCNDRF